MQNPQNDAGNWMNPLTPIRSYLSEAWKMTCLSRYSLSHKINQEPFMILWILLDHLHPTKPVGTTLRSVQKTKQLSSSHGLNKQTLGGVGSFQRHVDLHSNYINFTRLIGEGECTNPIWIQIMNSVYQSMVSYHKQTAHPENPSQNPSLVSQELGNVAPSTFCLGWKALIITLDTTSIAILKPTGVQSQFCKRCFHGLPLELLRWKRPTYGMDLTVTRKLDLFSENSGSQNNRGLPHAQTRWHDLGMPLQSCEWLLALNLLELFSNKKNCPIDLDHSNSPDETSEAQSCTRPRKQQQAALPRSTGSFCEPRVARRKRIFSISDKIEILKKKRGRN